MKDYFKVVKNSTVFLGRASRREYWTFRLINFMLLVCFICLDNLVLGIYALFSIVYFAIMIMPVLSVTVRRLHDIGKSGWMCLVIFLPIIGGIYIFILLIMPGDIGLNKYGENPNITVADAKE